MRLFREGLNKQKEYIKVFAEILYDLKIGISIYSAQDENKDHKIQNVSNRQSLSFTNAIPLRFF